VITNFQFQEMQRRIGSNSRVPSPLAHSDPVDSESKLHSQIMEFCDSQWPRWKYVHCRMDKKSTVAPGVHDLTIFGPHPLAILVECKKKDGKLSEAQLCWIAEMKMLNWDVHVVFSFSEFLEKTIKK